MGYIGQQLPADVFSGFTTDSFTGDGSATTFTLSKAPFSEDGLIVVINNVIQKPTTNFTVSGTTLTIVGTAVIVFVFRAMPSPGAGLNWFEIDVLGFNAVKKIFKDFSTVNLHNMSNEKIYPVQRDQAERCLIDKKTYNEMYKSSIDNPSSFWSEQANNFLDWLAKAAEELPAAPSLSCSRSKNSSSSLCAEWGERRGPDLRSPVRHTRTDQFHGDRSQGVDLSGDAR